MHNSQIFLDLQSNSNVEISSSQFEIQFPKHMLVLSERVNISSKNEEIFIIACGVNDANSRLEFFLSNGEFRFIDLDRFNLQISNIKFHEFGHKICLYEKIHEKLEICSYILNTKDLVNDSDIITKINFGI